jgi:hypothetical protein
MEGLTNVTGRSTTAGVIVDECRPSGEIQERDAAYDGQQRPLVQGSSFHRLWLHTV